MLSACLPSSHALPSPWVQRWARLLAPGASVLDVACGSGRHVRWLAAQGLAVTGIDRDAQALAPLGDCAQVLVTDLEQAPWPLPGQSFDAVLVTHYLWRPLFATLLDSVKPGGLLVYETFCEDQATLGKPSRPEFLLRHGELLTLCPAPAWRVLAYEDGFLTQPARFIQRIAAVRLPAEAVGQPKPYPLADARSLE